MALLASGAMLARLFAFFDFWRSFKICARVLSSSLPRPVDPFSSSSSPPSAVVSVSFFGVLVPDDDCIVEIVKLPIFDKIKNL